MALNLSPQVTPKKTLGSIIELKKKSLEFSLTEVFLLVVLIGLFSWFLVLPKWNSFSKAKEDYTKLSEDKSKIDGQIADLKSSIKLMDNKKSDFSKLDEALPLKTNPTTLQILFEEMTRTSDVTTRNLSVEDRAERVYAADRNTIANPYKTQRVLKKAVGALEVSGDFARLQAFLKKIEKTNRLIKITSVEFEREQGDTLLMRLNFEAILMNKKSTQIIVAILCFAGSGMVLYYGYFKPQAECKKVPVTLPALGGAQNLGADGVSVTSMKDEAILPLNKLQEKDLAPIKSINGDSYVDSYPKFDPKTEVGIEVKDLIPPLNKAQQ